MRGNLHFVRTFRRDVQDAIANAFAPTPFCLVPGCEEQPPYPADFEHARGVSALETPRYKLDPVMVDLVEELRPGLLDREMDRKDAGLLKRGKKLRARDRRNRHNMLIEDIEFARVIGSRHFRMRHYCDWRGRVFQLPYLNMQRGDHIKCMFKFANGRKLDSRRAGFSEADVEKLREVNPKTRVKSAPAGFTDHEILEIHCANCAGENKRTWEGRLQRREFFLLHRLKWLARLHAQNEPDGPPPPQRGWEFEDENPDGEYSWS